MGKLSGKSLKIVLSIFAVLLVVVIVGVALYFGLRGQGLTFYVECNGVRCVTGADGGCLDFVRGEIYEFSVKSLAGGEVDFDVKITSNADNNIRFAYNDEFHYSYTGNAETDDYSDVFGLQNSADGFSITVPRSMTIETALKMKYGGDITLIGELSDSIGYFLVSVTVDESSAVFPFIFDGQANTPVGTVTVDPPQIIF